MTPRTGSKLGGRTTTKIGPTSLSATRRQRNTQLTAIPESGFQTKTSERLKKYLLVLKVADKIGENWGVG
jgi:hypothetical protein